MYALSKVKCMRGKDDCICRYMSCDILWMYFELEWKRNVEVRFYRHEMLLDYMF